MELINFCETFKQDLITWASLYDLALVLNGPCVSRAPMFERWAKDGPASMGLRFPRALRQDDGLMNIRLFVFGPSPSFPGPVTAPRREKCFPQRFRPGTATALVSANKIARHRPIRAPSNFHPKPSGVGPARALDNVDDQPALPLPLPADCPERERPRRRGPNAVAGKPPSAPPFVSARVLYHEAVAALSLLSFPFGRT